MKQDHENHNIENIVPLGSDEIRSLLKSQSEAVFEDKNISNNSNFVKKSLIDIALDFKSKQNKEENEVKPKEIEETPTARAIVEEQISLPGAGVESEFRMIVQKLLGEGLDHQAIMENIEFQDISDRATAAGVNTWELFLKLAT